MGLWTFSVLECSFVLMKVLTILKTLLFNKDIMIFDDCIIIIFLRYIFKFVLFYLERTDRVGEDMLHPLLVRPSLDGGEARPGELYAAPMTVLWNTNNDIMILDDCV